MALGADCLQREFRGRLLDVVMSVAINADRIFQVDLFREIPVMRTALHLLGLLAVAVGAAFQVALSLVPMKPEFLLVGVRILVPVAAVAVGARHPLQIVHAAGEILDRRGQLAPGRQVAADAVRLHVRHRVACLPPLGKLDVGVGIVRVKVANRPLFSTKRVSHQADFRQPLPARAVSAREGNTPIGRQQELHTR